MPWPTDRKHQTRERILDSAVELFSLRGYDRVSVAEVMRHAHLTHGAFYTHFGSKQALYAEAVTAAALKSALARLAHDDNAPPIDIRRLLAAYLSPAHIEGEQTPCPLAFLATDVANREADVRNAYTRVFKRLTAMLGREISAQDAQRREYSLALAAMMIGGVAVGRALNDSALAEKLLQACRHVGEGLLEASHDA